MKRFFQFFGIWLLILLLINNEVYTQSSKLSVVVIDPGHGGKDPGAVGKDSKEKNIVLSIALKLGGMLKAKYPDMKVIYTRSTDEFIELYRRAKIANEHKADLFISIHCNSSKSPDAYGSETFVMGINKSKANLEVARKENASILFEDNYSRQYEGYDPYSPEATIIFSLYQNLFLDQSLDLATRVEKYFSKSFNSFERGVKQAGFLVLYNVTMPGILVEAGFISNPQEEAFLKSNEGQQKVAKAIFNAVVDYKNNKEGKPIEKVEQEPEEHTPDSIMTGTVITQLVLQDTTKTDIRSDTMSVPLKIPEKESVFFSVQFLTSPKKLAENDPRFNGLSSFEYYQDQKNYKYISGKFGRIEEAVDYQVNLKKKGFKDAFIVAFINGKRVSVEEARRKQK